MASDSPIATHLLKEAARIISQSGIESLKQRGFAKAAGTSPSVIAYHFEDMENFRTQAIWHALVNGIPSQFDMDIPASPPPASLAEWLQTLNGLLKPGTDEQPAGFYIGFARLTGQTCLLATRDPSLRPLVRYLRELEGWGTFRVFKQIPDFADHVSRVHAAAFGLWVKAEALLRRGNKVDADVGLLRLDQTASAIFHSPPCFVEDEAA